MDPDCGLSWILTRVCHGSWRGVVMDPDKGLSLLFCLVSNVKLKNIFVMTPAGPLSWHPDGRCHDTRLSFVMTLGFWYFVYWFWLFCILVLVILYIGFCYFVYWICYFVYWFLLLCILVFDILYISFFFMYIGFSCVI